MVHGVMEFSYKIGFYQDGNGGDWSSDNRLLFLLLGFTAKREKMHG